jgi:hypothetical protein
VLNQTEAGDTCFGAIFGAFCAINNLSAPLVHLYYDVFFKVHLRRDSPLADMKFQFQSNMDGSVSTIAAPLQTGLRDIQFSRVQDKVGQVK